MLASVALSLFIAITVFYVSVLLVEKVFNRLILKLNPKFLLIKILVKNNLFRLFAHVIVATVLLLNIHYIFGLSDQSQPNPVVIRTTIQVLQLYLFVSMVIIITRFIKLINIYYDRRFNKENQLPITSYIQVINLIIWLVWIVLVISFFLNISPLAFLTGIGAVSALFLLLFRDTLLGIVASIQASATNIVKIGDYIEVASKSLSGTVIDISITRVKIKNDDNSISTIPTYMLTSEVIKNNAYIKNSGAKVFTTSFKVNLASIKLINPDIITKLQSLAVITKYINQHQSPQSITNLELFREYLEDYLKHNPFVVTEAYPIIIRHLPSNEVGLPLQIIIYLNHVDYYSMYKTESVILEHIFVVLEQFDLEVSTPRRN